MGQTARKVKRPVQAGCVRVPVIMQMEALECGAACLAMVLAYYGKWVPLEQVRAACGVSRDGSTARNMVRAARSYRLIAKGCRYEPDTLRRQGSFPCIIHWNFNHFVVLDGFKGDKALLNDPDILILDEPTSGLDPGERVRFRNLLSEFAQDRIVLISTHIVSDVEYIAAQNMIMKDGRIVDVGATEQLLEAVAGKVFTAVIGQDELALFERAVRIVSMRGEPDGAVSVRYISDAPDIPGSRPAEPRLEDLYLWLFRQETPERGEERC